jgi:hypothetical protein
MRDHDPATHEEQVKLVDHAQERMNASICMSLQDKTIRDAIIRNVPPEVEHKEAS